MAEPVGKLAERLALLSGSRRAMAVLALAAAALGIASALYHDWGSDPTIRGEDALEHAVMARRLAQGEGFTTGVIYPVELRLGVGAAHPAVRQPPLWPLVLAGPFAVFGAKAQVAHAVSVAVFGLLVAAAAALAAARGGLVAGGIAALAVATTPSNLNLALEPVSATLFGFTIALALWLCAAGAPALWVGIACGLAYLTRYTGALLLPAALALVFARKREARAAAWCFAGFLLVAVPWWIRNWIVAGDPFYTLQSLVLFMPAGPPAPGTGPLFDPDGSLLPIEAASPMVKLRTYLPYLLSSFPFANANLAACAGVVLGCLRRDAYCGVLAGVAAVALLVSATMGPLGAPVAPLFPAMIALGAGIWMQHGRGLRVLAITLLLIAPLLPGWPAETRDLHTLRHLREFLRDPIMSGKPAAAPVGCLDGRPIVIAQDAPRVAWQTDAIALYAPSAEPAFWKIVEEQKVAFAQLTSLGTIPADHFGAQFSPRPDCAPDLFERRREPH